jgi:hypothetical protein
MFDWSDPNTFWLNITDIVLGAVTLACVAFVVQAALREILARLARRQEDPHALALPELGLTMADGGTPIDPKTDQRKK